MELDKVNIFDYQAPSPKDILAAGPGAIAAPLSPAEVLEMQKSQFSSDPVIRKLQKVGRGIGTLFAVETPLDYALSGLGAVKPVVAAGKGIAAVAKEADPKDLVFVHRTSEKAIKSFDNMGGIPSPSIAVTKADQPFTGFGEIQLIGKPEKFDPLVDPRNKIYSADAYTPRAPKKLRLAKDGAPLKAIGDYRKFLDEIKKDLPETVNPNVYKDDIEGLYDNLIGLTKDGLNRPEDRLDTLDRFFDSDIARMKFYKDSGFDPADALNRDVPFPSKKFKDWKAKQEDKYLSQDGVFTYFDEFEETTKTMPYTLDNVVENMIQETQRGGESGFGSFGQGRLTALLSDEFAGLPEVKLSKDLIGDRPPSTLISDVDQVLEDLVKDGQDYVMDLVDSIGGRLQGGSPLKMAIDDAFDYDLPQRFVDSPKIGKAKETIFRLFDDLKNTGTEYFEAKPTRAVGLDEFAGAIVPEATSKEVIDILEKNGLKVIKQTMDERIADPGGNKVRQAFKDQFFSAAPIAAAASATAMIDSQNQGIGSL